MKAVDRGAYDILIYSLPGICRDPENFISKRWQHGKSGECGGPGNQFDGED